MTKDEEALHALGEDLWAHSIRLHDELHVLWGLATAKSYCQTKQESCLKQRIFQRNKKISSLTFVKLNLSLRIIW